jgi:hypothetical protein
MEIRIGIRENQRDVSFESNQAVADVTKKIDDAFASKAELLRFEDEKGKTIIIPVASIAYIEIGAEQNRRVGFIA